MQADPRVPADDDSLWDNFFDDVDDLANTDILSKRSAERVYPVKAVALASKRTNPVDASSARSAKRVSTDAGASQRNTKHPMEATTAIAPVSSTPDDAIHADAAKPTSAEFVEMPTVVSVSNRDNEFLGADLCATIRASTGSTKHSQATSSLSKKRNKPFSSTKSNVCLPKAQPVLSLDQPTPKAPPVLSLDQPTPTAPSVLSLDQPTLDVDQPTAKAPPTTPFLGTLVGLPLHAIVAGTRELPALQSIGCNPVIRPQVHNTARTMFQIAKDANQIRSPWGKSEFAHCIQPHPIQSTGQVVYTKYTSIPNYPHNTKPVADTVGFSAAMLQRGHDLNLVHPIICCERFSPIVDGLLNKPVSVLVEDLMKCDGTPYELRLLLHIIWNRGGHRLGFKKKNVPKFLELGAQLEYALPGTAEIGMCDTAVIDERRRRTQEAVEVCLPVFENFVGCNCSGMNSWATGAKSERLSSNIVCVEYALDVFEWEDAIQNPAVLDAATEEEIFSTDFLGLEESEGTLRVIGKITRALNSGQKEMVVLDRNETVLFPNGLLERILVVRFQFRKLAQVFGDEVLVFGTVLVRILLHRPFCITGDSRWVISMQQSILRGMALEFCASIIAYIQGKPATTYQAGQPNAITAGALFEMATVGYSLNKKITVTILRDVLTDDDTFACLQNALAKSPGDVEYPDSRRARREYMVEHGTATGNGGLKNHNGDRVQDSFIVEHAKNLLSFTSSETIATDVASVINLFAHGSETDSKAKTKANYYRWKALLKDGNVFEPLLSLIKQHRPRQNSGNTSERGVPEEELKMMLQETRHFWIRINKLACDSPYDGDDDSDEEERPVYRQYTLSTFKKKARKAGKALVELESKNGFVLLGYKKKASK